MKKLLLLSLMFSFTAGAQTIESHIFDSVKPLGKVLEGKKGKVALGIFKSVKVTDKCTPSKSVNSKVSSALLKAGVKTVIANRAVGMDAEQTEISRVTKLSGASYIVLGTYELTGTSFKIDCAVYDHNGAGVGACDDVPAVALTSEQVEAINCPKEEKPIIPAAEPEKKIEEEKIDSADTQVKKIDDYICSVIHRDYDLKRMVANLYEKKFYTLEELKGVKKDYAEDALEVRKENCVTLGNFVMCTDFWQGSGAQVFLGDTSSLGSSKILSWKHPNKAHVSNATRCLKKDDNWWNP
jgi:hypothetical protein